MGDSSVARYSRPASHFSNVQPRDIRDRLVTSRTEIGWPTSHFRGPHDSCVPIVSAALSSGADADAFLSTSAFQFTIRTTSMMSRHPLSGVGPIRLSLQGLLHSLVNGHFLLHNMTHRNIVTPPFSHLGPDTVQPPSTSFRYFSILVCSNNCKAGCYRLLGRIVLSLFACRFLMPIAGVIDRNSALPETNLIRTRVLGYLSI
ncbi:unnamed protein product [Protopolystoma xenopodis]|uniref:Uncharacterized protein n=1 Tax=Protopolystoma xenopodis TaxID=117903 RepID=A0A448XHZ5_9PLAT|nr:unnamed protein product [Protopolystoma xenopodis]